MDEPVKTNVIASHPIVQPDQSSTDADTDPVVAQDQSSLFGVSVRGWIAFLVVLTMCAMSVMSKEASPQFYIIVSSIVAYYFGHANGRASK